MLPKLDQEVPTFVLVFKDKILSDIQLLSAFDQEFPYYLGLTKAIMPGGGGGVGTDWKVGRVLEK